MPKIDPCIVIVLKHEPLNWSGYGKIYACAHVQNNGLTEAHEAGAVLTPSLGDSYGWGCKYGYLDGLRVSAQYSADRPEDLYDWGIEYAEQRGIRTHAAEVMAKTLRKIDRDMAKIKDQFGYTDSFGEYVARFAAVLGCCKFGERRDEIGPDGSRYRWRDVQGMRHRIAELHKPKQSA